MSMDEKPLDELIGCPPSAITNYINKCKERGKMLKNHVSFRVWLPKEMMHELSDALNTGGRSFFVADTFDSRVKAANMKDRKVIELVLGKNGD